MAILFIDIFDSILSDENDLNGSDSSVKIATINIAKISLKEMFRVVSKEALSYGTGLILKSAANQTMRMISKKIPLYGVIFGVFFAGNRISNNHRSVRTWILALMEICSGVTSIIPYIGKLCFIFEYRISVNLFFNDI